MGIISIFKKKKAAGFAGSADAGQFTLDFYYDAEDAEKCKVEIRCGVVMDVVLKSAHEGYGFLMSCFRDGAKDAMEAYCGLLWRCSMLLALDDKFPSAIHDRWMSWVGGMSEEARAAAAAVTAEQEQADQALMEEAARIGELPAEEKAKLAAEIAGKLDAKLEEIEKAEAEKLEGGENG